MDWWIGSKTKRNSGGSGHEILHVFLDLLNLFNYLYFHVNTFLQHNTHKELCLLIDIKLVEVVGGVSALYGEIWLPIAFLWLWVNLLILFPLITNLIFNVIEPLLNIKTIESSIVGGRFTSQILNSTKSSGFPRLTMANITLTPQTTPWHNNPN